MLILGLHTTPVGYDVRSDSWNKRLRILQPAQPIRLGLVDEPWDSVASLCRQRLGSFSFRAATNICLNCSVNYFIYNLNRYRYMVENAASFNAGTKNICVIILDDEFGRAITDVRVSGPPRFPTEMHLNY